MVIANILNTYTTVAGLWQYDYGQILRLQGIKLPTAVEIHFSLQEKGGESVTRIGTTKDGVTDVVIPDSMLENDATTMDYKIYAFIYLADSESGQTEYKISMSVKSRPKPEGFEKPEDAELFRQAITEVNNSAEVALQSKKEAEAWAHGHVEYADRDEDNAKYYAKQAKDEAEKIQGKVKEGKEEIDRYIKENRNDLKGEIGKVETSRAAVELCKQEVESAQADVEQMRQDTQQAAQNASDANAEAQQAVQQAEASRSAAQTSEQNAAASRDFANTYKEAAETAKSAAETAAQNASESKTAAETAAQNAAQSKADIDSIKAGIEEAAKGENVSQIQKNMSDIGQLKESVSNIKNSGTGLSNTAKNLLIVILKNAVYTVNQKTNIEALENALSTQNTPTDAWSIVQNLTYVTSTNTAFNVKKGESYTTSLVANTNYTINSVTVVMGGVDITNTAYNNGVITINSVTGNVTITAIAKKNSGALLPSDGLLANFDFRNKEMTSYNLSGWGNVYKCDDETGNYLTFGTSAKTASQGGMEQYAFRDVRKKDNESKSVDLGTDFTVAMYSTEVPNILGSTGKSNVSVAKIILVPKYINTSASEVTAGQTMPDISRDKYMSLIITVSGSVIKMYVDGTLQKTYNGGEITDFKKWKSTPVQPLTVYNEGTIAATVMYNKALSDNDVTELHAYFKSLEVE